MRALPLMVAALFAVGCEAPDAQSANMPDLSLEEAAATITPEALREKLSIIAHDSMMGRDTPSEELDEVAAWIAAEFASYGLEPGNGDSYIQRWPYPLIGADWEASSVELSNGATLAFGTDVAYTGSSRSDGDFTAGVVIVSGNEGDVAGLTGVEGRHVVLLSEPAVGGGRGGMLGRGGRGGRGGAGALGAANPLSVIQVVDPTDEDWQEMVEGRTRVGATRVYGGGFSDQAPPLQIRRGSIDRVLEGTGVSLAALPGTGAYQVTEVPGVEMTVQARAMVVSDDTAPNVIGILPGSDPALRDEYVVFSAHMDHVGVNGARARPDSIFDESGALVRVEMDSIFNGADDDGSGTVMIVQLAAAFASLETPPARSLVFLGVSGEEKGLLGSRYYAQNPTVPIENVAANLNTDMIGRNWEDTVVVIGKGHSDLGDIMNEIGERHPELNMAPIDDLWPDENFYGRSDHANFARRGVPVLFFFTGTHEDYHGVNDEVDRIGYDKMSRIGQLDFYIGYEVANRPERPVWNVDSLAKIAPDSVRERVIGGG